MKKSLIGNVVSINEDQLMICGYDHGSDEDREAIYFINPKTRLNNIESLDEISRDDQVKITYEDNEGRNTILNLLWQGNPWANHPFIRPQFSMINTRPL